MLCVIKMNKKLSKKKLALVLWVCILPLGTCHKKRKTPLNDVSVNVSNNKNRRKKTLHMLGTMYHVLTPSTCTAKTTTTSVIYVHKHV